MYEGGYRSLCKSSQQVLAEGLIARSQIKFHKTSREWLLGDKELNGDTRSHSILTDTEVPAHPEWTKLCEYLRHSINVPEGHTKRVRTTTFSEEHTKLYLSQKSLKDQG